MVSTQMVKIVWYYNRDIFDRLGLQPPKDWAELLATCEKLRAKGVVPLTLRFNYRYYQWLFEILYDQFMRANIEHVRARPGDWCFDPERDGKWKYNPADPFNDAAPTINFARLLGAIRRGDIRYDTPAFERVLDYLKSISVHTPTDFLVDTPSADAEAYTLFLNGQAAIHLDTSMLLNQLDADVAGAARFRWGSFDTPSLNDPLSVAPARAVESAAGEYVAVIRKNQQHTDHVIDFLQFWLSPRGYQIYVDAQVASGRFKPHGLIMVKGVILPPDFQRAFTGIVRRGNAEFPLNYISGFAPSGSRLVVDFKRTLASFVQGKIDTPTCAKEIQRLMMAGVDEIVASNHMDVSFLDHPERDPNG
jgi:ABC-type glycerol-3-phosphate transport system substrate-binding protein